MGTPEGKNNTEFITGVLCSLDTESFMGDSTFPFESTSFSDGELFDDSRPLPVPRNTYYFRMQ